MADAAKVAAVACQYDEADSYARPAASPFAVEAAPNPLRVGVPEGPLPFFGDTAYESLYRAAIDRVASLGAEIVATGSIHIYGALRGRVLAGADGNQAAHIFCHRLAAELVAIDGYYRMAEDLPPSLLEKPAHAWLEDGILTIKALD
ncbi:hypothetical protein AUC71_13545 [Methyloceanibacter marginalis]|uniref:Septum formation inhibitor MinC C-terminal domain-containing protein n=1 Tax=Methyloceanibacter marginalis TaxID=1774971 RepID=A0A1E3WAB5_9HYPH|nr:hypothetical protein AUC71_13545 [Methyloceanibacter marginalis]